MEMFYEYNHSVYQDIDYRDLLNKACYPKEISDIRNKNLTFTITNAKVKNQGQCTETKYSVSEAQNYKNICIFIIVCPRVKILERY